MRKKYTNISIPTPLALELDQYIKENPKLSFSSRAGVVCFLIRNLIIKIVEEKE